MLKLQMIERDIKAYAKHMLIYAK